MNIYNTILKLNDNELLNFRKEIYLNSYKIDDYKNSFCNKELAFGFFRGYLNFLKNTNIWDNLICNTETMPKSENDIFGIIACFDNIHNIKLYIRTIK